jgi:hypothetical protein
MKPQRGRAKYLGRFDVGRLKPLNVVHYLPSSPLLVCFAKSIFILSFTFRMFRVASRFVDPRGIACRFRSISKMRGSVLPDAACSDGRLSRSSASGRLVTGTTRQCYGLEVVLHLSSAVRMAYNHRRCRRGYKIFRLPWTRQILRGCRSVHQPCHYRYILFVRVVRRAGFLASTDRRIVVA